MLKRLSIRKITLASAALFACALIYLVPSVNEENDFSEDLEYVDNENDYNPVFLLDKNNYVALTEVSVNTDSDIEAKAREVLEVLIIGSSDGKVPNGFSAIIPPNTEILSLTYNDGLIKVDFSSDILEISEDLEEKMIEAIVYSLTAIDGVDNVIIYVEGEILSKLPKTKINLPSTLNRSFGINKEFNLTSTKDITDVTVYYINQINDNYYYVPVTKYLNDTRDKITIVIDELTGGLGYNDNLMSFLNEDVELVSSNINDNVLSLDFNSSIFDDINTKEVLEEVIYTICLSAYDNYDVDEVVLLADNEEIYKSASKTIEKHGKM